MPDVTGMTDTGQPDVIEVLIHDHREVEEMFGTLENAGIGDARNIKALVDQVIIELSRHSVAEEEHLYPAVRRRVPNGDALADQEIREHAEAEVLMKALDGMEPNDPDFGPKLAELMAAIRAHIAEEEGQLFPALVAHSTRSELDELGVKVVAAKKTAPTRPHPSAPDTPPMDKLVAPALGLVDKVRDALAHRGTKD